MITSIQVYSDVGPWGNWEPFIKAEMERVGIPYNKRKTLTVILSPISMKPKKRKERKWKS